MFQTTIPDWVIRAAGITYAAIVTMTTLFDLKLFSIHPFTMSLFAWLAAEAVMAFAKRNRRQPVTSSDNQSKSNFDQPGQVQVTQDDDNDDDDHNIRNPGLTGDGYVQIMTPVTPVTTTFTVPPSAEGTGPAAPGPLAQPLPLPISSPSMVTQLPSLESPTWKGFLLNLWNAPTLSARGQLPRALQIDAHYYIAWGSLLLATLGFFVEVYVKYYKKKIHFKTWHAFWGLFVFVFVVLQALAGTAIRSYKWRHTWWKVHRWCGVGVLLGLYLVSFLHVATVTLGTMHEKSWMMEHELFIGAGFVAEIALLILAAGVVSRVFGF